MAKNYRHFLLAGLSGLLFALAYPGWPENFFFWKNLTGKGFDLGFLAWVGFIPLFWSLAQFTYKSDRFSVRNGFLVGFTTGLVYFLIVFRWLWSTYPLDTLGISNNLVSAFIILMIYLINATGMAVFWGLFGIIFNFQFSIFKKNSRLLNTCYLILATPALFVLLEYLRSWGFGFLWAGSGSLFGPHWTLGNLAYALADNSLIRWLASYVGIYGITFLIVFINIILLGILARGQYYTTIFSSTRGTLLRVPLVMVGFVLLYIILAPYAPRMLYPFLKSSETGKQISDATGKRINFAIIQTARPSKLSPSPQETLAGFKEQLELLNRVAKEHPESQLIVFPEASDLFKNIALFLNPAEVQNYFSKLFKEPRLIISGGRVLDAKNGNAYSRVYSLDTQEGIIGFYDKRLLAPGGEFLPYPVKLLAYIFSRGRPSLLSNIHELSPGQKDISTVGFRYQFNVAPLICSELTSPGIAKQATQNSDVIVSMASYGTFHGNRTITDQVLAITRFRAVENNKPIITAANLGRSHVIDSQGNLVFLVSDTNPQILTGALVLNQQKSWYNKLGDIPILVGSLMLVILGFRLQVSDYRKKVKSWLRKTENKL